MDLSLHPASSGVAARQRALAAAAAVWGVCLWCVKGGRRGVCTWPLSRSRWLRPAGMA